MQIAQETRRAETYPYLVIRSGLLTDPKLQHIRMELMNVGGNAAKVEGWYQSVSGQFQLGSLYFQSEPTVAKQFYGAILKNEKMEINILRNAATRTLVVLDIADTRQGRHQFTILVNWDDETGRTVEGNMVHPDVFLPFRKRWMSRLRALMVLARKRDSHT